MSTHTNTLSSRVSWIDICRGIAILFVMYAHMLPSDSYRYIFYSFHMPLFFFLSGIVFKETFKSIPDVITKSFKTILIPYFIFAVLTYLFWFIKEPQTHNTMQDFMHQVYGIFYGNGNNGYLYFNVALWFLPCLFITKVGFAALTRWTKSTKGILISLFVFSLVGYVLSAYFQTTKLPFGIETAFSAIVFFGAGFLVKRHWHLLEKLQKRSVLYFLGSLLIMIVLATISYNIYGSQIDMRMNRINNYFLFYSAAFSGILVCIVCSQMIGKNYILEYIGQHTLILFVWHYLLFSYLNDITSAVLSANMLAAVTFIKPTIYTLAAVGVILLSSKVLKEIRYTYLRSPKK